MKKIIFAVFLILFLFLVLGNGDCSRYREEDGVTLEVTEKLMFIERTLNSRRFCSGSISIYAEKTKKAQGWQPYDRIYASSSPTVITEVPLHLENRTVENFMIWSGEFITTPANILAISILPDWQFPVAKYDPVPAQSPIGMARKGILFTQISVYSSDKKEMVWDEAIYKGLIQCKKRGKVMSAEECKTFVPFVRWRLNECPDRL